MRAKGDTAVSVLGCSTVQCCAVLGCVVMLLSHNCNKLVALSSYAVRGDVGTVAVGCVCRSTVQSIVWDPLSLSGSIGLYWSRIGSGAER